MTTIDFNALSKIAEDAGFDTTELAPGRYDAEVTNANFTTKSNGKSQFGFRFKVLGGPVAGQGVWKNLNVPTAESKPTAVSIFLRELNQLGVDQALASVNPEAAAQQVIGRAFDIEVKRDRAKQGGGFWTDVNIKGGAQGAAPAAPAPAPSAPVAQAPVAPAWQQEQRPV